MKKVASKLCLAAMSLAAVFMTLGSVKATARAATDQVVIDFSQGQTYTINENDLYMYDAYMYYEDSKMRTAPDQLKTAYFAISFAEGEFGELYHRNKYRDYPDKASKDISILNNNPFQALFVNHSYDEDKKCDSFSINGGPSTGTYEITLSEELVSKNEELKKSASYFYQLAYWLYGIDAIDANGKNYLKIRFVFKQPNSSYSVLNADGTVTTIIPDQEFTENGCSYKVTGNNEVTLTGLKDKNVKSVDIPAYVTHQNFNYKVTGIGEKAISGCKKLKSVTIGQNVTTLGRSCIINCKKLGKITITSTSLSSVGKRAIRGNSKDLVIKAPKALTKAYKKMLKKAGISSFKVKGIK